LLAAWAFGQLLQLVGARQAIDLRFLVDDQWLLLRRPDSCLLKRTCCRSTTTVVLATRLTAASGCRAFAFARSTSAGTGTARAACCARLSRSAWLGGCARTTTATLFVLVRADVVDAVAEIIQLVIQKGFGIAVWRQLWRT